ncbi:M14 family metallopeptidase [Kordiimonas sp. SCSIO 12610]|uniref:M14 family metallopeptidase n=1 Tax=Kordiimonas sp. SCSIO 12610 TaxID=2829597 RepID=UPI00210E4D32|nr:M14 family metallopeptidase [Kordiimonas sp. SCSIO 12610]UTW56426.1 hypothetical protein KFF44_05850 [Kordiimonas sp. SCSIO 12610]
MTSLLKVGKSTITTAVLSLALLGTSTAALNAEDNFTYWPNAAYTDDVPSLESVVGHKSGDKITTHANTRKYFEALAAAKPDQVRMFEYGESWEGRSLYYLAISSAENIAKLDDHKAGIQALADPRKTSQAEAERLIDTLPSSVWLSYGVHGNEISSTDASIMTAYHLLASKGDERAPEILDNTIVFINPMQNPDGRDRFIHRFRSAKGLEADSDRLSAEHNEPWPSGRTNHYLFDMNRDWISLTQPEIREQVKALQEWYPLTFVDLHEMGGDSTYYFAPEAIPYNPHLADSQRSSLILFGQNNAKWFDAFGRPYFTRDIFDAFYPGYGASWPAYYGAVAMTYEQASSRGLKYRRTDGSEFDYRDTVKGHFLTSLATAETVAKNRKAFLQNFYDYQVSAISEGSNDRQNRTYIFPATRDKAANNKLAGVLAAQGVEITRASADFKACNVSYKAGAYVIDLAQPRKRMVRSLLDPQVDMNADFVKEQERRREKNLDHDIYDVTGWSLPIMYNVDMNRCGRPVNVAGDLVDAFEHTPGSINKTDAKVAYLVPWGDMAAGRLLTKALRAGITVKSNDSEFTQNGRTYPTGSLIIDVAANEANVGQELANIAKETGAEVVGVDTSWIESGMDFGSRSVNRMHAPKIAMAWDEATSQYSAGNTRYVIEQQFGYPVTVIRTPALRRADLSRYDVLILPAQGFRSNYMTALGEGGAKNLKDWVSRGGVLIGNSTAVRFLSDEKVGLLNAKRENQAKEEVKEAKLDGGRTDGRNFENYADLRKAIEPAKEGPDSIPGVIVNADVDKDHWLANGVADELKVLVRGGDIYTPVDLNTGTNVAYFKGKDELLASGHIWEENKAQLAYKPFLIHENLGRGMVIGFTQEPTTRAYLDGLNLIYMNAIFGGTAHARPVR